MKNLFYALVAVLSHSVIAGPVLIVSMEEMNASNNATVNFVAKSAPVKDAPFIELIAPKLPGVVTSPTSIELKFRTFAESNVRPESFKALYGTFEIDITKKLLSAAKVTDAGVNVPEASLPKGKHKILLVVEDSAGRIGSRLIEFHVN